jgi:branched-subunit amino acid transport protein
MSTWLVILAVGAGSFILRAGPLLVGGRWTRTPWVERAMPRAGTAATAALAVSALTRNAAPLDHTLALGVAGALALAFAVRGTTMLRVLVVGAASYALVVGAAGLFA